MKQDRRLFRTSSFDPELFLFFIILIGLGLAGIYASGTGSGQVFFLRQFLWFSAGIIVFFLALALNYLQYQKYAEYIYAANMILLALTLIAGVTMRNTRGWITFLGVNFQFSEIAKISFIFLLAKYLSGHAGRINKPRDFILPALILLLPFGLIMIQPDLGTALVLFPIFIVLFYLSGVNDTFISLATMAGAGSVLLPLWMSYYQVTEPESDFWLYRFFLDRTALLFVFLSLLLLAITALLLHLFTSKTAYRKITMGFATLLASFSLSAGLFHFLKLYHKQRFLAFLDPSIDRLGAGYNIIQSSISIGSGRFLGKGFLKGSQTLLGFLPAQNTDFIFAVLAEQFGFLFVLLLFTLFFLILRKGLHIVRTSKDMFGSLVAAGIVTYLFSHFIINIGMATGLMPVIGLPLPFLSYGGSSLVTSLFSMAVLMNIQYNRFVNV